MTELRLGGSQARRLHCSREKPGFIQQTMFDRPSSRAIQLIKTRMVIGVVLLLSFWNGNTDASS